MGSGLLVSGLGAYVLGFRFRIYTAKLIRAYILHLLGLGFTGVLGLWSTS